MHYKNLLTISALLCIHTDTKPILTLQEIAANAILEDESKENLPAQLEAKGDGGYHQIPYRMREYTRSLFLLRHLREYYQVAAQERPLLKRSDNRPIRGAFFIGDSSIVLSIMRNGEFIWWNGRSRGLDEKGALVPMVTKDCGQRNIGTVTVNSEGTCIATASGNSVKVWLIHEDSITEEIASFTCPFDVSVLAFDLSTTELLMGDVKGYVRLFELASRKPILVCEPTESFEQEVFNHVVTARICSDRKLLLAAGYTLRNQNIIPCIHVWDRLQGKSIQKIVLPCSAILGKITIVDDTRILASFTNGELYSVNRKTGATTKVHRKGYSIDSATLSPDGRYLVTASARKDVTMWACKEGQLEKIREFHGNGSKFHACSFSADSSMLLVGGIFGDLSLWSVREAINDLSLADAVAQMRKRKETDAESGSEKLQALPVVTS